MAFWNWRRKAKSFAAEVDAEERRSAERAETRRAYALGLADGHRSHYNAAKAGRRTSKWGDRAASANAVTAADGRSLRRRARHQIRNSPHASKARMLFVSSVVGDGIRPQVKTGSPKVDQLAERLFAEWSEECDADGRFDFYGLQRLVAGTVPGAGGCLFRRRPRRMVDGLAVPLQIQVMEVDHLDDGKSDVGRSGGRIVQGVEFDAVGKRSAYWLFPYHPNDVAGDVFGASKRVPASEVGHVYHCDRPGQVRELPWLAPVMMLLEDLEAYIDAEVYRKRTEACMVGIFKGDRQHLAPATDSEVSDVEAVSPITDVDGVPMGDLQPGEFYCIDHDDELVIHQPTQVTGIEEFTRVVLREIATGLGMTYELLAGDLSKVNFSSIRAGNIEWRRLARSLRKVLIVRQFCEPVFRWWLDLAIASGRLPAGLDYRVEWVSPHFEEVDRLKDLQADAEGLASAAYTFRETLARRGKDFDQHVEELVEEREKLAALGISADWLAPSRTVASESEPDEAEGAEAADDAGDEGRVAVASG